MAKLFKKICDEAAYDKLLKAFTFLPGTDLQKLKSGIFLIAMNTGIRAPIGPKGGDVQKTLKSMLANTLKQKEKMDSLYPDYEDDYGGGSTIPEALWPIYENLESLETQLNHQIDERAKYLKPGRNHDWFRERIKMMARLYIEHIGQPVTSAGANPTKGAETGFERFCHHIERVVDRDHDPAGYVDKVHRAVIELRKSGEIL